MKRKLLFLALTLAACFMLLPSTALAVENDVNGDTYHDGDVAVINALIENNGLGWTKDNPGSWGNVWTDGSPKRIKSLGSHYGGWSGDMDVSGLEELENLYVYNSTSLSAIGVACHEAGHAIQHATNYGPLGLRSSLVPVINLTSPASYILIIAGVFLSAPGLIKIGILCFAAAVVFALVTLPVEFNASARAKTLMVQCGIVSGSEARSAGEVLNAAFLTYVASAVSSLLTLLYYIWRFTSDRD